MWFAAKALAARRGIICIISHPIKPIDESLYVLRLFSSNEIKPIKRRNSLGDAFSEHISNENRVLHMFYIDLFGYGIAQCQLVNVSDRAKFGLECSKNYILCFACDIEESSVLITR